MGAGYGTKTSEELKVPKIKKTTSINNLYKITTKNLSKSF